MSTRRPRRPSAPLPDWLATPRRAELARDREGKPVRITIQLTAAEKRGLDRIEQHAKREAVPLSVPEVIRLGLDRLLADYDAAMEAPEAPEPEAGS
jgi:hypothetical protein